MAFRVLVGCNYRPNPKDAERRAEVGDLVDDVPKKLAAVWLEEGILGPADGEYAAGIAPDGRTEILVVPVVDELVVDEPADTEEA